MELEAHHRNHSAISLHSAGSVWLRISVVALCAWWMWLASCLWPQWAFYEAYQYGWFAPCLIAALFYRRWLTAPEPEQPRAWLLPALAIVVAALCLVPSRLIYEANSLWRTISWPLGLGVVALTLSCIYRLGGRAWLRHFLFPALFILVALPWPGSVENKLIQPLTRLNTGVTAEALFLSGVPALQQGSTIELVSGQVGVDEACSGIRSFHSTLMVALLLGELYGLRVGARFGVLLGGVVLAFACNVARTFVLSWICAGKGTAGLAQWHDPLGLAVAVTCMVGVWAFTVLLHRRRISMTSGFERPEIGGKRVRPASALPMWLCITLGLWLVVVEAGTRAWFRARESTMTHAVEWSVTLPGAGNDLTKGEFSEGLQRSFRADETLSAHWTEPDGSQWQMFYLRWAHGSPTAQLAKGHWPEICLASAGKTLSAAPETKVFDVQTLRLPFRAYAFDDNGRRLFVFHCVWEERGNASFGLALDLRPNLQSRMQAAWLGKRNLGQQLLEIGVWGFGDARSAESAFARQLEKLIKVRRDGGTAGRWDGGTVGGGR